MTEKRFRAGVDSQLKSWLNMRNSILVSKKKAKEYETVVSEIKYRSRSYWTNEIFSRLETEGMKDNVVVERGKEETKITPLNSFKKDVKEMSFENIAYKALNCYHTRFIREISNSGHDINGIIDTSKRTMLHLAAMRGDLSKVNYLIERGANVNARDTFGNTPLHLSIREPTLLHPLELIQSLLNASAEINAQCNLGYTALHKACILSNQNIIRLLLRNKADVYVLDKNKKLAIQYGEKVYVRS
jgi:hypothetical protein